MNTRDVLRFAPGAHPAAQAASGIRRLGTSRSGRGHCELPARLPERPGAALCTTQSGCRYPPGRSPLQGPCRLARRSPPVRHGRLGHLDSDNGAAAWPSVIKSCSPGSPAPVPVPSCSGCSMRCACGSELAHSAHCRRGLPRSRHMRCCQRFRCSRLPPSPWVCACHQLLAGLFAPGLILQCHPWSARALRFVRNALVAPHRAMPACSASLL